MYEKNCAHSKYLDAFIQSLAIRVLGGSLWALDVGEGAARSHGKK
jgi:hypothetical protein